MNIDILCPFCDITEEKKIFRWANAIPKELIPYNRKVLYRNEYFVIIPDISPIAQDHVLIIPFVHYNSLSEIPEAYLTSLSEAKNVIKRILKDASRNKIIFFEHGSCSTIGSACISHAHLHCIPLSLDEISKLENKLNALNQKADFPDNNESYLYLNIYKSAHFRKLGRAVHSAEGP